MKNDYVTINGRLEHRIIMEIYIGRKLNKEENEDDMTETEALEKYFANSPKSVKLIKSLLVWDDKKTIRENAKKLGVEPLTAQKLKIKFGLSSAGGYRYKIRTNKQSLQVLKENGLNNSEIARLLGVSPERIRKLLKISNLLRSNQ